MVSGASLGGLTLGVIALTVVVSVMNGFDAELKRRILGVVPHVTVGSELAPDLGFALFTRIGLGEDLADLVQDGGCFLLSSQVALFQFFFRLLVPRYWLLARILRWLVRSILFSCDQWLFQRLL